MIKIITDAIKTPAIKKKMLFLLWAFFIYSLGSHIPVPGINNDALSSMFSNQGTLFGMMDMFVGGSLRRFSIFALGITPYINASIIFQLLTVVVPKLEELAKEGESGRKIISQWTKYLTIALAFFQAVGMTYMLASGNIMNHNTPAYWAIIIFSLVGGTSFLMWLGEQITQKGVGNGVSLIIFIGIVNSLPQQISQTIMQANLNSNYVGLAALLIISLATIGFIIYVHLGQMEIKVNYNKRIVGRKVIGGQTTYLPMKVNTAGVIPIIFAISLMMFPATIAQFMPYQPIKDMAQAFNSAGVIYNIVYFALVFVFTFFYTAVVFNPKDVADRLQKHGGVIQGFRPGTETAKYLERKMVRITFIGAMFLASIAVLPSIVVGVTKLSAFSLGGTSILIIVGVALDTVNQIEAQVQMHQISKKGRFI